MPCFLLSLPDRRTLRRERNGRWCAIPLSTCLHLYLVTFPGRREERLYGTVVEEGHLDARIRWLAGWLVANVAWLGAARGASALVKNKTT